MLALCHGIVFDASVISARKVLTVNSFLASMIFSIIIIVAAEFAAISASSSLLLGLNPVL
ncbi:MAG: hypothetical protein QXP16_01710 [Candidatus Bathyarchaeia archaeon]